MEAIMISEIKGYARFVSEQPPYNLLDRRIENEIVPMCQAHGLGLITWSPMAMGILAGRYTSASDMPADSRGALRGGIYAQRVTEKGVAVGAKFVALAKDAGISPGPAGDALGQRPTRYHSASYRSPVVSTQMEHLTPVMDMTLSPDIRAACDDLVAPGSAVASFYNSATWMKQRII